MASVAPRLRIVRVDLLVRGFPFVRRVRRVLVHDLVASYGRIVHVGIVPAGALSRALYSRLVL